MSTDLQHTNQLQREIVGKRFAGASLSGSSFGREDARKILDWLERRKNFLVFLGAPGVGKTYFCAALIPWIYKKMNHFRYFNERTLLSKIRSSMDAQGDYLSALERILDSEFVIIDDLGSSGFNEWRTEVLFDAIDKRYESELPTVFTSNLTRKQLFEGLGGRGTSRLFAKENVILEMHDAPDKRQEDLNAN